MYIYMYIHTPKKNNVCTFLYALQTNNICIHRMECSRSSNTCLLQLKEGKVLLVLWLGSYCECWKQAIKIRATNNQLRCVWQKQNKSVAENAFGIKHMNFQLPVIWSNDVLGSEHFFWANLFFLSLSVFSDGDQPHHRAKNDWIVNHVLCIYIYR